jgi:hypothetical protein
LTEAGFSAGEYDVIAGGGHWWSRNSPWSEVYWEVVSPGDPVYLYDPDGWGGGEEIESPVSGLYIEIT